MKLVFILTGALLMFGTKVQALEKYPDYLEVMAKKFEPGVLAKKEEIATQTKAEWENDKRLFKFEARRFGDFLTVFVERGANPEKSGSYPRKFSTSVNLMNSTTIELHAGHVPDLNGAVDYVWGRYSKTEPDVVQLQMEENAQQYYTTDPKGTGFFKIQQPYLPVKPAGRRVFNIYVAPHPVLTQSSGAGIVVGGGGYVGAVTFSGTTGNGSYASPNITDLKTENYPRFAEDDTIHFNGIDATIYAPAGTGQQVYDTIMKEIKRGAK